ncbi:MAG TPA: hypothetical protein VFT76_02035 [Actinomycetota bacterium]|nr:hypothetical protein [Actinomycetota bacterium]
MTGTRPAETIQAALGTIIGAILIIVGVVRDGFDFSDLADPELQGAISILVGFVASAVTWYVARRQRDPEDQLASAPDGTVVPG